MAALSFFPVFLSVLTGGLCTVTTLDNQEVLEGQSLTIPCHYNPQYKHNVKYWCQGRLKDFCTTLARTDQQASIPQSTNKVTIADDPTQNVFMMTMQDLKQEDSNWYWCGVEVGNMWTADITAYLYITVKDGIKVKDLIVRGQEGGTVSAIFTYSIKLREVNKTWCRSGDPTSCKVADPNGKFVISDDRKSTVTVTFKKLEQRDAGWYWCAAGHLQDSVKVEVTLGPTTTAPPATANMVGIVTPRPLNALDSSGYCSWETPVIICGVLIALLVMCFKFWNYRKQQKNQMMSQTLEEQSALMVPFKTDGDWQNSAVIILNPSGQKYNLY